MAFTWIVFFCWPLSHLLRSICDLFSLQKIVNTKGCYSLLCLSDDKKGQRRPLFPESENLSLFSTFFFSFPQNRKKINFLRTFELWVGNFKDFWLATTFPKDFFVLVPLPFNEKSYSKVLLHYLICQWRMYTSLISFKYGFSNITCILL